MQTIKQINIPSTCSQNWRDMVPNHNGRHCANCQKTVVDFTNMTDRQVIEMFNKAGNNVCGRFAPLQLASINHTLTTDKLKPANWWKRLAIAATVLWGLTYFRAPAMGKIRVEHHPLKKNKESVKAVADSVTYIT